jgi:predicted small secreted protein
MLRNLTIVALLLVMTTLTACSTVSGAGQDIQDASSATKNAIHKTTN